MDYRIVNITLETVQKAADLMAGAFHDQPVFEAIMPAEADRLACLPPLFAADIRNALRYGGAIGIDAGRGHLLGAAYWTHKPEPDRSPEEDAELGFTAVFERWGELLAPLGEAEGHALECFAGLSKPWRYLAGIGVRPDHQGEGHGSRLMDALIEEARIAGQPFALVTDRDVNLPFYERAGFRIVAHEPETPMGVPFWSMLLED
jgi:GNAT superfamily N-acetyltransferase